MPAIDDDNRFRWEAVPRQLLASLAVAADGPGEDPAAELRHRYGDRPTEGFVTELWPVLRDGWLDADEPARGRVLAGWLGSGADGRELPGSVADEPALGAAVLAELVALGSPEPSDGDLPSGSSDSSGPSGPGVRPVRQRVAAWSTFTDHLAAALAVLDNDQFVVLQRADRPWFVQFGALGVYGLRAELVSNAGLPPEDQLDAAAVASALELGWLPPVSPRRLPEQPAAPAVREAPEGNGAPDRPDGGAGEQPDVAGAQAADGSGGGDEPPGAEPTADGTTGDDSTGGDGITGGDTAGGDGTAGGDTTVRGGTGGEGGSAGEGTPDRRSIWAVDASPNHFREWPVPVPFTDVARLTADTLVEVLDVAHPAALRYQAFTGDGVAMMFPSLGQRLPIDEAPVPEAFVHEVLDAETVAQRALEVLRRASGDDGLEPDDDGDIPLKYGSSMVFVRVFGDPPVLRVYSPAVGQVPPDPKVTEVLNDLNTTSAFTKWLAVDGTIIGAIDLFGSPFNAIHLLNACSVVGHLADDVDEHLQGLFGGKTFFGEYAGPKLPPGTGGYL